MWSAQLRGNLTSTNALTVQWQPASWLPLDATVGLNTMQRNDETYIPYGVNTGGIGQGPDLNNDGDTTGSYGLGHGTSHDQTLNVRTAIPSLAQHITLAVGGNVYSSSTADFTAYTNQLSPGIAIPPTFDCPSGIQGCISHTGQSTSDQSTYGWYFELRGSILRRASSSHRAFAWTVAVGGAMRLIVVQGSPRGALGG